MYWTWCYFCPLNCSANKSSLSYNYSQIISKYFIFSPQKSTNTYFTTRKCFISLYLFSSSGIWYLMLLIKSLRAFHFLATFKFVTQNKFDKLVEFFQELPKAQKICQFCGGNFESFEGVLQKHENNLQLSKTIKL